MRQIFSILIAVSLAAALTAPVLAAAPVAGDSAKTQLTKKLGEVGQAGGYSSQSALIIAGQYLRVLFGILGVIFMIMLLYGGFLWMTDQGQGTEVKKAKDILRSAVIGLIIVVVSYAFTTFVINNLQVAAGITGPTGR